MKEIIVPTLLEVIDILKELAPDRTYTAREIINRIVLQAELGK